MKLNDFKLLKHSQSLLKGKSSSLPLGARGDLDLQVVLFLPGSRISFYWITRDNSPTRILI
jgi:hypothetical protein